MWRQTPDLSAKLFIYSNQVCITIYMYILSAKCIVCIYTIRVSYRIFCLGGGGGGEQTLKCMNKTTMRM